MLLRRAGFFITILMFTAAFSQVTDPMLDVDFLFSDTLKALPSMEENKTEPLSPEVLKITGELQREIEKLNREIARLKNRIALLEESRNTVGKVLQVDILSDYYTQALKYYNESAYEKAASLFAQVMSESSDNDMRLNSMFWAAECAFRLGNYNRTVILLTEVLQHQGFGRQEDACILVAAAYERLERPFEAKKYYRACLRDYPEGKYSALAARKLGGQESEP